MNRWQATAVVKLLGRDYAPSGASVLEVPIGSPLAELKDQYIAGVLIRVGGDDYQFLVEHPFIPRMSSQYDDADRATMALLNLSAHGETP